MFESKLIIGVISRSDYDNLPKVPNAIAPSMPYNDWLAGVRRRCQKLREEGLSPTVVLLELSKLPDWCKRQARTIDTQARLAYAFFWRHQPMQTAAFLGTSCLYLQAT
jgi:hypothetical protein